MTAPTSNRAERLKLEVEEYWPRLTRFYGFSWEELYGMPRPIRRAYIKALPRLQAEEQLAAIEAASFSNMKTPDQRATSRRLQRLAQFKKPDPVQAENVEEAQQMLAGMGIGFEVVKADD